jgi:6-phosphofructokinase 1
MLLDAGDTLGILTSGGDAPGMNAALRGVVRAAQACGLHVLGIEDGFRGLLAGQSTQLAQASVDDASRRGGTLLGTARSAEFRSTAGLARAAAQIATFRLAGLVVIGGNGSLAGALALSEVQGARGPLRIAGIPASIDNDLAATTMAIGVDTALNTIVEACDRICDTATAHRRVFIVEVMGRECGYLAMAAGIAACADLVLVPALRRPSAARMPQAANAC